LPSEFSQLKETGLQTGVFTGPIYGN